MDDIVDVAMMTFTGYVVDSQIEVSCQPISQA